MNALIHVLVIFILKCPVSIPQKLTPAISEIFDNSSWSNQYCSNLAHGELYSIQHYVIKLVSDLWQVGGFLQVLQFPPPIKLTDTT